MKKYILELTEQEINNLKAFLNRTTLSGKEALQFMILADKIEKSEVSES